MLYVILAILATIVAVGLRWNLWINQENIDFAALMRTVVKYGTLFVSTAIVVTVITSSVVIIQPGYRGVVFNRIRGVRPEALEQGIHFILPIVDQVTQIDVRVQKDSYDASAASKDLQIVHTQVALNFHPIPEAVPKLYQEIGVGYSERVIHPSVQEAVKATTARFTAEELVTHREEVKRLIRELVEKQISIFNVKVDELYITDFDFSKQFAEAIESKQIAEQQALKAKRDLDRIKIEAEQKIASARAEAESLKMQREAITSQLISLRQVETQKLAIEKWDGHMPGVILGAQGGTPLLDLNGLTTRSR